MNKQKIHKCKHSKENKLFWLCAIVTIILLSMVVIGFLSKIKNKNILEESIIWDYDTTNIIKTDNSEIGDFEEIETEGEDILLYFTYYLWLLSFLSPILFFILMIFISWKKYGSLKANSLQINQEQYPEVYKIFVDMAQEIWLKKIPELYLVNLTMGVNPYTNCVIGYRNFSIISADILEKCLKNNNMENLKFILAHELGHIKYNHVTWWYNFLTFWLNFPVIKYFLWSPLSRAREYSCDNLAKNLSKNTDGKPLMMLWPSKHAYEDIDMEKYMSEHFEKKNIWVWIANFFQAQWALARRVAAVRKNHEGGIIFKNKKT